MVKSAPLVSIGLPVYNGERYLEEAIDSVLEQTYEDFELVLLDNASTDRTPEICRAYAARDNRVRYHRNEQNIGHTGNVNRAVRLARGRYYRQHHDDDVLVPQCVERCVEVLENRPAVVLCHTETKVVDEQGVPREVKRPMDFHIDDPTPQERFDKFLQQCYPTSGLLNVVFGLVRREVLLSAPSQGAYPHADAALYGGLTLWGKFYVVDECLFRRRDHPARSMRAFEDDADLLQWLDPNSAHHQLPMLRWWALRDLLAAIWWAPLSARERLQCLNVARSRYLRHFYREIIGEIRRGAGRAILRRLPGESGA